MNIQQSFENIHQRVFKTIYFDNIATQEIVDTKNIYPYFMFTRYLLAYKQKESFQIITLEAALQTDPLWFGYVLQNINKKIQITTHEILSLSSKNSSNSSQKDIQKNIAQTTSAIESEPLEKDISLPEIDENIDENSTVDETILPAIEMENIVTFYNNEIEPTLPIVDENMVLPTTKMDNIGEENEIQIDFPVSLTAKENNLQKNETPITEDNPLEKPNTTTPFLPLHVEDYFGALNMNLSEDKSLLRTKPSATQKPFLDWIDDFAYSYKKNNSGNASEKNDIPVASETMAEIWIAEKRYDKAIATYEKLSLLFPDKSIYFAQKISELKHTLK